MDTLPVTPPAEGAQLIILEEGRVRTVSLDSRNQWSLGREAGSGVGIPLTSALASREHGWFMKMEGRWYYVDNPGNTNGTFYNGSKLPRPTPGRNTTVCLNNRDILRIDNEDLNRSSSRGILMMFSATPVRGQWRTFFLTGRSQLTIGRDPGSDIVEPQPYVSRRHARLELKNGLWLLSDCGSIAGTFLNGKRITSPTPLREKDCISLYDRNYFFLGDHLLYAALDPHVRQKLLHSTPPGHRQVVLRADIRSKTVKSDTGSGTKQLLRDVKLEIREGTLVALLGTAGAGKSTLMNCLNGMDLGGVTGSVIYRDVNLMENFDQMKYMIGSVPQQKTFHPSFTPELEFRFAARKRLPADTSREEIQARVDQTLKMLSIDGVRRNRNSKLSGGEQTRVNVGIELVADRDLLCLDEPDQGLSPNYKHELFEILRNLAHKNGKSVLTIIHDVSEINLFDQVIILAKVDGVGRLAFSGSPEEARAHFGADIRDVYALLEREPKRFVR